MKDEYGLRPWQKGFEDKQRYRDESGGLYRFQGEFAQMMKPYRRGRCFGFGRSDPEKDSDDLHAHFLSLAPGKRK